MNRREKSDNKLVGFLSRVSSFFIQFDYFQIVPMVLLLTIGVMFIYGTGQQVGSPLALTFWKKQLVWIAVGFIVWLILSLIDYRHFTHWAWLIYATALVLLVLVMIPSIGVKIYGARRWLDFGPVRFQPSELGKLGVLLLTSWVVSFKWFNINRFFNMCLFGVIVAVPFFLILLEPDLGSSLVLIPMAACVAFVGRLKWRFIIIAVLVVLIAVPSVYPFLSGYQKERILVFLDPSRDPQGKGWNSNQSSLAVGSGGMYGKGFRQGTQNTLGFLPQTVSNTDFIFSVIAEELGFVGSTFVVGLYAILIFAALKTGLLARDSFGRFVATGIAAILFSHVYVNVGMSIRLMPITGLPLPLVSYGGSFLVNMMVYLGILQSIHIRRRKLSALL